MSVLEITSEIEDLAEVLLNAIQITRTARADAVHLATASFHGIDYLVTCNCRHIASARVRREVAAVNAERRVPVPGICTPEELMEF
mgnify:CR=1 FL=1